MIQRNNKITILGSGTSTGIPMLGCQCPVCTSTLSKNKRLRTSILIQTASGLSILVDTGPDLRHQLLKNSIDKVDFAFITHGHADHTHGIDDLRPLTFPPKGKTINIYTHSDCAAELRLKFPYIFNAREPASILGGGIPNLALRTVEIGEKTLIEGEEFEFIRLNHGHTHTLGIIHQKMAYIIDCHEITADQIQFLKDKELNLLIIDCVTDRVHQTHLWQERAFEYIAQIRPRECGLIHMNHSLEHQTLHKHAEMKFTFPVYPTYDSQILYY